METLIEKHFISIGIPGGPMVEILNVACHRCEEKKECSRWVRIKDGKRQVTPWTCFTCHWETAGTPQQFEDEETIN